MNEHFDDAPISGEEAPAKKRVKKLAEKDSFDKELTIARKCKNLMAKLEPASRRRVIQLIADFNKDATGGAPSATSAA